VQLHDLLDGVEVRAVLGPTVTDVASVTRDSRAVERGSLFCCIPGARVDGHDFAAEAVAAGAVAVLVDHELHLEAPVTQVVVDDVRGAVGLVAAALHGHPSRSIDVVGITGTNGKTTTAWLLRSVLEAAGRSTEMIGTLTSRPGGPPTTPDAIELQAELAQMRDRGVTAVAMEVSSHALAQSRVEGTEFAVAVFTNLSRDHLDYHETMEDYFAAKALLFEPARSRRAVVNVDDPRGRLLLDAARIPTRGFSLDDVSDLRVGKTSSGTWRGQRLDVPFAGAFNVSNALAAANAALDLGIDEATIVRGIATAPPAPGRFELVDAGQPFLVAIDYAHTPDGIEHLLESARRLADDGQVTIVFGAGGDKDRGKRPLMGAVASQLADVVVLTSDNPRSEDPMAIIDDIRAGMAGPAYVIAEPDRRAAIELALARATARASSMAAGKGHETTQTIGDDEIPFDDRLVVKDLLT